LSQYDVPELIGDKRTLVYLKEGQDINIGVELVNTGKTIANHVGGCVKWSFIESDEQLAPLKCTMPNEAFTVIYPGMEVSKWSETPPSSPFKSITPEMLLRLRIGRNRLYFAGHITYQDIFGREHFSDFCMLMEKSLLSFVAYGPYNTAD